MNSLNARYEHAPEGNFVPSPGRATSRLLDDESGGHGNNNVSERNDGKENNRRSSSNNNNNNHSESGKIGTEDGESDAKDEVVLYA